MSIRINGKKYINGTVVRANPVEEATGTLNKIGIGSDVYEIQGGGGSGVYVEDELYTATSTNFVNIPVNWNWNDYDLYVFRVGDALPSSESSRTMVLTKGQIQEDMINGAQQYFGIYNYSCSYYITSNEITTREHNSFVIISIRGIKTSGDYFSPVIYSEEEREIGVWKDNKPLYQKTIIVDSITHTGEIDVSSLNIDTVVKMNGIANYPDNQWVNFPFYHNDNYYVRVYYVIDGGGDISDNCIYFEVGNSAQGLYTNGFLTLQYTKTTDVPGSGSYNTLGVPTVHYSTDEQVIGTWVDGSTIYQKTITQTLSATDTIMPNTSNVDRLVQAFGNLSDSNGAITYFPYTDGEDYASAYKHASNGIHMLCTSWFINNRPDLTLTIQYTKTSS